MPKWARDKMTRPFQDRVLSILARELSRVLKSIIWASYFSYFPSLKASAQSPTTEFSFQPEVRRLEPCDSEYTLERWRAFDGGIIVTGILHEQSAALLFIPDWWRVWILSLLGRELMWWWTGDVLFPGSIGYSALDGRLRDGASHFKDIK
jgi:hypothetical protein